MHDYAGKIWAHMEWTKTFSPLSVEGSDAIIIKIGAEGKGEKGVGMWGSKEGFLADRGISWLMFLREGRRVGKEGASYFPFYFVH